MAARYTHGMDPGRVRAIADRLAAAQRDLVGVSTRADGAARQLRESWDGEDAQAFKTAAHDYWASDWKYLATAETQRVDDIDADVPGLALPRSVIDKIYYANAKRVFFAKHP